MKKLSSIKQLHSFLLLWGSQTVSQLGTAMVDYALIIWVYGQAGTASSITLLTLCTFLPTIFFRFLAGSFVDRWDKKRVMLTADLIAACETLVLLILYSCSALRIWHLYVINFLLSFMNAFQEPASFVATGLLVPKEYYTKASGIQGFGGAAVSILAPALGAALSFLRRAKNGTTVRPCNLRGSISDTAVTDTAAESGKNEGKGRTIHKDMYGRDRFSA